MKYNHNLQINNHSHQYNNYKLETLRKVPNMVKTSKPIKYNNHNKNFKIRKHKANKYSSKILLPPKPNELKFVNAIIEYVTDEYSHYADYTFEHKIYIDSLAYLNGKFNKKGNFDNKIRCIQTIEQLLDWCTKARATHRVDMLCCAMKMLFNYLVSSQITKGFVYSNSGFEIAIKNKLVELSKHSVYGKHFECYSLQLFNKPIKNLL